MKYETRYLKSVYTLILVSCIALLMGSCDGEISLFEIVLPADLVISGNHATCNDAPVRITLKALDDQGNESVNAHCTVQVSASKGSVSPDSFWLEGARTEVELTVAASGLIELYFSIGDFDSSPYEILVHNCPDPENTLAVVVSGPQWQTLKTEIVEYIEARTLENWNVQLYFFSGSAPVMEVRDQLRAIGPDLKGAFFIGELPVAWFSLEDEQFPIDLYYMDLDGTWIDSDGDGMFEDHIGAVQPDIFLGRVDGPQGTLSAYFQKIEQYRTGALSLPARFMAYVDDDWTSFHYGSQPYYYGLEQMLGPSAVDLEYDSLMTNSTDYATRLGQGYQLMQIMAHSDWTYSTFSMTPSNCVCYAHTYLSVSSTTEAWLSVKITDPFKLYLNGALLAESTNENGTGNGYFDIPITLISGSNRLLLKIAQGIYYSSYDRFTFEMAVHDGTWQEVPGLEQQSSPPQYAGAFLGGYITGWLLSGPYHNANTNWWNLLNKDFIGGESTADPSPSSQWSEYQSPIPNINLRDAFGNIPNESVAYGYVRVYSPFQRTALLSLGFKNNGIAVWLNGERVVFQNDYDYEDSGYQSDQLLVPVTLLAGPNRLLIKVRNWWTNDFAFSARFIDEAGAAFTDLTFDPAPDNPLQYDPLVQFLVIGLYHDADPNSRFNTDYLGGESGVGPDAGDQFGDCYWKRFDALNTSIDLNNQAFFGLDGGNFSWDMIGQINPRVHFYNQFNCSGARYVETPCMGYSYILDNDYGLISVGSTKTGAMLNFEDYYSPLARSKTFGQSFLEWFQINGEDSWSWFYGMTLLGDPTLTIKALDTTSSSTADFAQFTQSRPRSSPDDPQIRQLWQKMKEQAAFRAMIRPALTYQDYLKSLSE
ncbi:hypothetical protein JXQ70_04505 [bacterium]|nr:hypothetical protein [bacterium]